MCGTASATSKHFAKVAGYPATQIGYKKNDGKYHYQYDRIRAMRREIDDTK